ncbi:ABC transporter ATP-binding protein [Ferrimonas lipolytica]|uniref:ABC transporter ATP-binding protein n=1 Tax=Ferrimonas lipolytica TaxID=2724191 RepID=A0A6H1UB87_9GAMM|nr:dipeptide/oligopeptide/nickel ABC transporter ATP-binding protein [Ferrimonas lipolytica]QIZ76321.1 ABC transporter ATP-binding protein [Ferrimonas lipolytica]
MDNTTQPLLQLRDVDKYFDNGETSKHVLKSINLSVKSGENVGIVGASGSGKSTLARLLCRIHQQERGDILFAGEPIDSIAAKHYFQQVQMVFQDPLASFPPRMKVEQYLLEPFKNFKRLQGKEPHQLAKALLEKVHLPEAILQRYPNQLSGGQLQRIVFARATGLNPSLLICDEATSALDATIQKQVLSLFDELQQQAGFASLFITHDLALAESFCDIIHVMEDGRIVETLTSGNIVSEAQHPCTQRMIESSCNLSAAVALAQYVQTDR